MTDTAERPKAKRSARKLVPLDGESLEACEWRNNADLIADVMGLYCEPGMTIMDMTYGDGKFWTFVNPSDLGANFIAHDIDRLKGDGVDWAHLPENDASVDIAIMDPDYVARGGRETSTIPQMVGAYGMDHADATPDALWTSICEGIDEAYRVLKPGGLFMLKCMNYISSGKPQTVLRWAFDYFALVGFKDEDWAILVGGTGPQPLTNPDGSPRRQVHLRQNASHLLIVRKPRTKR